MSNPPANGQPGPGPQADATATPAGSNGQAGDAAAQPGGPASGTGAAPNAAPGGPAAAAAPSPDQAPGAAPAPPQDPAAVLRQDLEKARAEAADWKKQYHRGLADYDNLRKRTAKEVLEASTRGKEDLVKKLLPVLDTFNHALNQMAEAKVDKKVMEGIEMLFFQFSDVLEKDGLKAIPALNTKFNPEEHEAMMRSSDPSKEDEIVVKEFELGYKFKERVIRTAKVEINSK